MIGEGLDMERIGEVDDIQLVGEEPLRGDIKARLEKIMRKINPRYDEVPLERGQKKRRKKNTHLTPKKKKRK